MFVEQAHGFVGSVLGQRLRRIGKDGVNLVLFKASNFCHGRIVAVKWHPLRSHDHNRAIQKAKAHCAFRPNLRLLTVAGEFLSLRFIASIDANLSTWGNARMYRMYATAKNVVRRANALIARCAMALAVIASWSLASAATITVNTNSAARLPVNVHGRRDRGCQFQLCG
jgi:hypothetical protein